jgi:NF-kappa-B-activating protein C-terminal domain
MSRSRSRDDRRVHSRQHTHAHYRHSSREDNRYDSQKRYSRSRSRERTRGRRRYSPEDNHFDQNHQSSSSSSFWPQSPLPTKFEYEVRKVLEKIEQKSARLKKANEHHESTLFSPSTPVPPMVSIDTNDKGQLSDDEPVTISKLPLLLHNEDSDEDSEEVGPLPLLVELKTGTNKNKEERRFGGQLMPGEGSAIATFVQNGQRIPRRGEIGIDSTTIEHFEKSGYVMSGSR